MEKTLNIYLDTLKEKYNYTDKLTEALKKIIPGLINLYGISKVDLILDAIYNCEIKIKDKNPNPKENSAACYGKSLILDGDKIIEENEIIVYTDKKDEDTIFTNLTHEICHLVKGYKQLYREGNKIITKCGLIKQYFNITGNSIVFTMAENVELEEAINSYDTSQVLSFIYEKPTIDYAYNTAFESVKKMVLDEKIIKTIRISQFNNIDTFYKVIGKDNYQLIDEYLKKINYLCLLRLGKDISIDDRKSAEMIVLKAVLEANDAKINLESLCTEIVNNIAKDKKMLYVKKRNFKK